MRDDVNPNEERADWAAEAVDAFAMATRLDASVDGIETVLGDLLCNLRHFCDRHGLDFAALSAHGKWHYDQEIVEDGPKAKRLRKAKVGR